MRYYILAILFFFFLSLRGQTSLESLEVKWNNLKATDKQRLDDLVHNGLLYIEKGQYNDAHHYFERIDEYELGKNDPKYQSMYILNKAWSLSYDDSLKIETFKKSIDLASKEDYKIALTLGHTYSGIYYRRLNELDSAVYHWNKALLHSTNSNDYHVNLDKGWTEIQFAMLMIQTGNPEKAQTYEEKAMRTFWAIPDEAAVYFGYYELGMAHQQIGQYSEALVYFNKALPLTPDGNPFIHLEMAYIYEAQGDWEKAAEYYQYSKKQYIEINRRAITYRFLPNLGRMFVKIGELEEAQEVADTLLTNLGKSKGFTNLYKLNTLLGDIALFQKNINEAVKYYQSSLDLQQKDGLSDSTWTSNNQLTLSRALMEKGRYSKAIEHCLECEPFFKGERGYSELKILYETLYEAYKKLGNDMKALEYLEKLKDLLENQNPLELERQLQKFEYSKQLLQDSLKQAEKNLQLEIAYQTKLRQKSKIQNLLYAFGIFLCILAIGLFSRLNFVRRTKNALQEKNQLIEGEKEKAKKSQKAKQQFLANMSHEIRTPINAIKGMTDILLRRNPEKSQLDYLTGIKQSTESLLVIINDILDISKIEEGRIELERIPLSIEESIAQVFAIMQYRAEEKGLELDTKISDTFPLVMGDPTRLRQVLLNLVGNAIKFTHKGMVTISAKQIDGNDEEAVVQFCVSDTGIGIEQNQANKIFLSFEQANTDTSRKFGGTGLGLSISKKLVKLHGGEIWVESEKDKGSQFYFTIPYKISDQEHELGGTEEIGAIDEIKNSLSGIQVLLAEDNTFNAIVAQEELEDAIQDIKVDIAENGSIAVEKYKMGNYDVILMDVQMPLMNGYEATQRIKALSKEHGKIPIIAMTANVLKEEVEKCYEVGMDDFIGKPFDIDELIIKLYGNLKEDG